MTFFQITDSFINAANVNCPFVELVNIISVSIIEWHAVSIVRGHFRGCSFWNKWKIRRSSRREIFRQKFHEDYMSQKLWKYLISMQILIICFSFYSVIGLLLEVMMCSGEFLASSCSIVLSQILAQIVCYDLINSLRSALFLTAFLID